METKKQKGVTLNDFMLIVQGHAAFQLLWAGVNYNVFDILHKKSGKCSYEELTRILKLKEIPANILLNGLLTLGFIIKNKKTGNLENSKLANDYLVSTSPINWIGVLGWQNYIVYPAAVDFIEALKTNKNVGLRHFPGEGNTLYKRLVSHPQLETVFQNAMQSLSDSANHYLIKSLNLKKNKYLLDFGGGNGTNAVRKAQKNNHLRLTVFDLPSICKKAVKNIHKNNLSDRISVLPGDMFHTKLPSEIDCVLYSHIVTIWSPEKNIELFKRIYAALPTGGKIFVFSTLGNDDGIGPITTALGSVYFQTIATGEAMIYSKKQVSGFLQKAGFNIYKEETLPLDHTLLIGIKK